MKEIARYEIPAKNGVRSLCWAGDELVDWAGGIATYRLDGSSTRSQVIYAYPFDHAIALAGTPYVAIYARLGTKGLILRNGKILREINRSFYHANVYDYPVALFKLPDERPVIAHCPEEYCKIEIEDLETGEVLTKRDNKPLDFFHSRLRASSDGQYLISAGWAWTPYDLVELYDVAQVLKEPALLDAPGQSIPYRSGIEMNNACFLGDDSLIITASEAWELDEEEVEKENLLNAGDIGIYSLKERRFVSISHLEEPAGTLMAVEGSFVVGFYEHPKLIELATGNVISRWPEIASGKQNSSICRDKVPPLALDPQNMRFAVAGGDQITVVQLGI